MKFGKPMKKTMSFGRSRYTVYLAEYSGDQVWVLGGGLLFALALPKSVRFDDHDLRAHVAATIEAYKQRSREASDMIQQRVRDGKAGI